MDGRAGLKEQQQNRQFLRFHQARRLHGLEHQRPIPPKQKPATGTGGQQPDRQTLLRKPIQPCRQQRQLLRRTAQRRVQPEVEDVI